VTLIVVVVLALVGYAFGGNAALFVSCCLLGWFLAEREDRK